MKNRMSYHPFAIALVLASGLALSACDNRENDQPGTIQVDQIEEATPSAEQEAAPVVAETTEAETTTVPTEALPPTTQSSEESVQPESETLFY